MIGVDEEALVRILAAVLQTTPNSRQRYLMRRALERERELAEMARHVDE